MESDRSTRTAPTAAGERVPVDDTTTVPAQGQHPVEDRLRDVRP
ncbi:MAG TPA: hypothetical protein VD864_18670 [Nocardioides sp.]|nr:hypothetical protein [Nocardioides sp.]